jgi:hypothetical protein
VDIDTLSICREPTDIPPSYSSAILAAVIIEEVSWENYQIHVLETPPPKYDDTFKHEGFPFHHS